MTLSADPVSPVVRPRVLAFGAVHPAVFELQARLNAVHAQALSVGQPGLPSAPLQQDGHFGPRTQSAVLGFQQRVFPDPSDWDGKVGPRTWAMLDRAAPGLPVTPPPTPPPLQTTDEVRRRALALIGAYVPSEAGDGRFDEIARDYGEPCLRRPEAGCGTTCGFLPHWLLWRLGCSDLEIVNRAEPGGYRYRPSQNISRLWSYGQPPFLSALTGALQQGQRPEPGDIVFLRSWPDGDSRSEHVMVFLEERREDGRTVWHSADAGQREGGLEAARYRERELTLHGQQGRLGERTVIGWLPLGRLHFDRQPPAPIAAPASVEPSIAEANDQTADLGDAFFPGLMAVAASVGTDPLYLLQTMMAESDIRADAHNPHGDASGLIQFMPDTLRRLGWAAGHEAFRRLSAEEQLPYVQRYYFPYRTSGLNSTARLRQATFLPATLSAGSGPDTVLAARDGPYASAYRGNSGLDRRHDGTIRVSDLTDAVERRCRGPRWAEARARLEAARGTTPTPPPVTPPGPAPHGTPPAGTPRPVLRPGARGPWVTQAQRQLNRVDARQRSAGRPGLAAAPLEEDGHFGPRTGLAVRDFQSRAFPGQPQEHDGVIGPHTWRQLDGWSAGTPVTPPGPLTPAQPPSVQPSPPQPSAPPGDSSEWGRFRNRLVQVALEEYARWHTGGQMLRETDPRMRPVLKGYWTDGPGLSASQAEQQIDHRSPWSAAFISWIMKRAGAGQMFHYASFHTRYCAAAKRNRLRRDLSNPFWLYRTEERAPRVGDLVCKARAGSGVTFDNVDDGHDRESHCDVVVEVRPNALIVIGGNVNNNVDHKTLRTDASGHLLLDGTQSTYYAVLGLRTDLGEE